MKIGRDCNLVVHMYRGRTGAEIDEPLVGHAALLRRRLEALQGHAAGE